MPLLLGQLVYTSFPKVGYRALASAQVPTEIQQAFVQKIVYQYWDCYNPPKSGYRAAYLYQVTLEHTLFGWLYNDGLDDLGRSHLPYFICYYWAEPLHAVQLENIFTFLRQGPVALIDRQHLPDTLETIVVPHLLSYHPARAGVALSSSVREHSHIELQHKSLLDLFIPVDESAEVDANEAKTPATEIAPYSVKSSSQTTKIALLVGVSEYGVGFNSLPAAAQNVQAIQQVLQHPDCGFTEVSTLLNPAPQEMIEAIETVFSERQSDDVVLLYFCGHGPKDGSGKLYLGTNITRKNSQDKLVKSSAVLVSLVQEIMRESRSLHQVAILDCCFSATATEEWHGQQQQIILAAAAIDDPKHSRYRQEVEHCAHDGEISLVDRSILGVLRETLGLLPEEAAAIEMVVLAPYREYQQKLQRCVREWVTAIQHPELSSVDNRAHFQHLQLLLGLRAEDVAIIEADITRQIKVVPRADSRGVSPGQITPWQPLTPVQLLNFPATAAVSATTPADLHVGTGSAQHGSAHPPTSANVDLARSVKPNLAPADRNSRLLIGVSIAIGLVAGMGVIQAYIQLNEIRNLKTEAKYEECITKTELQSWVAETVFQKDAQRVLNECRLEQAKTLAVGGKFLAAIKVAEKIPKNSPLYSEAQKLLQEWSEI